ncbi:Hypothetical protein NTJ_00505 [Nesidiocoris tenuis]|uniref:Uncharacterized protein n=1 Tax=Nesidiocoris tenuis TaxID=355587 RepID=A0ABN7A650_9HEMI|nr:Hypothetical protein NTJ_00505 [Nesidiocoris tenuis]
MFPVILSWWSHSSYERIQVQATYSLGFIQESSDRMKKNLINSPNSVLLFIVGELYFINKTVRLTSHSRAGFGHSNVRNNRRRGVGRTVYVVVRVEDKDEVDVGCMGV